jgi:hypothetical protein
MLDTSPAQRYAVEPEKEETTDLLSENNPR